MFENSELKKEIQRLLEEQDLIIKQDCEMCKIKDAQIQDYERKTEDLEA